MSLNTKNWPNRVIENREKKKGYYIEVRDESRMIESKIKQNILAKF